MEKTGEKELLLDKLIGVQDIEAAKQPQEMDTDLIAECSGYILELTGEKPPPERVLEQMKQKLLRRLFGRGRVPMRRKGLLRKLLIAAIVAILIVAMSVSMLPLGTNDESLMQRWGYALQRKGAGTRMDFGDYLTLAEEGKIEEYKSVRQFARKTHMDILVPTILPKGYDVQNVVVSFDYLLDCPAVDIITNNPSDLSVSVYLGKERVNTEFDKTEQIGAYSCGLLFLSDSCQCEFCFEDNCYRITATSYKDVQLIIENMKGSLKQ